MADMPSGPPSSHLLAELHRTVGNQAVQRMLKLSVRSAKLHPKLTVNAAGDAFEQEADRVAEQVMRTSVPDATARTVMSSSPPGVLR